MVEIYMNQDKFDTIVLMFMFLSFILHSIIMLFYLIQHYQDIEMMRSFMWKIFMWVYFSVFC